MSEPYEPALTLTGACDYKPTAKRLRERATMNILTVEEPYPEQAKKITRQLLSALEAAEREIDRRATHATQQTEIDNLKAKLDEATGYIFIQRRRKQIEEVVEARRERDEARTALAAQQAALRDVLCNVSQIFNSWRGCEEWSQFDEETAQAVVAIQRAITKD